MVRPKQFLDFGGRTCLEVMVDLARRPGTSAPIVVLGSKATETRERIWLEGCKLVVNEAWERGQTCSVRAGLLAVPDDAEGALLLPVDMPLLQTEDVEAVLAAFRKEGDRFGIFVATHGGRRGHPVLFTRRIFPEVHALADDQPLSNVVRRDPARVREVPSRNPGVVTPMNTPEEYAAVLAEYQVRQFREGIPSENADVPPPPYVEGGQ